MGRELLKKAAIQSIALMLAVITLSYALHQYRAVIITAKDHIPISNELRLGVIPLSSNEVLNASKNYFREYSPIKLNSESVMYKDETKKPNLVESQNVAIDIDSKLGKRYLIIKKPQVDISFHLEDLYITRSIKIELSGLDQGDITSDIISRVYDNEMYSGDAILNSNDFVQEISVKTQYDENRKKYNSTIQIEFDDVYSQLIYENDENYFIDLRKPKEIYDKVIVIDAGHGGKDGGAISVDKSHYEKNINLDIVMNLKKLLDKENIKVYYTRISEETLYLSPRVALANAVDCDFFISIHNNASLEEWPNGTEILYYDTDFKNVRAKQLAIIFSDELGKTIPLEKRGLIEKKDDEVYILNHSLVPSILIEVGYLTNNNDMKYLSVEENRETIALGIFNGIMRAYEEFS